MNRLFHSRAIIISFSLLASMFLSWLAVYHYPIFNFDGVRYLLTAHTYLQHGLSGALHAEDRWPFYSIAIAWMHRLTGLSLLQAAYVLNALFDTSFVLVFILWIRYLGLPARSLWWLALLILVYRLLNGFRADIIRDHGYWFCWLLSLWSLVVFRDTGKIRYALIWSLCSILASAFRIEGGVFLIFIPFIIFLFRELSLRIRWLGFAASYSLTIILVASLAYSHHLHIGRLPDLMIWPKVTFLEASVLMHTSLVSLQQHVLNAFSQSNAPLFLWGGMVFVYSGLLLSVVTYAGAVCVFYAIRYRQQLVMRMSAHSILLGYGILNLIITILFYAQHLFIVDRYVFPLALVLWCYVPFGFLVLLQLQHAWFFQKRSIHRWILWIVVFGFLSQAIGDLHPFGPTHRHIAQAVRWVRANTQVGDTIYTNQSRIPFMVSRTFLGWNCYDDSHCFSWNQLSLHPWRGSDYALFEVRVHSPEEYQLLQTMSSSPVQVFFDERKKQQVMIFQLTSFI